MLRRVVQVLAVIAVLQYFRMGMHFVGRHEEERKQAGERDQPGD